MSNKYDWEPNIDGTYFIQNDMPLRINLKGEIHHLEPGRWTLKYIKSICEDIKNV